MDESVIEHLERTTREPLPAPMKLSEAIREGAKKRPQGYGNLFWNGKSCALGAAYEGATGRTVGPSDYHPAMSALGLWGSDGMSELAKSIYRKNDSDRWTREQIADWLESQGY